MPDLSPFEISLLVAMPLLMVASGFFSGSETALFGLRSSERRQLARRGGLAAFAVEALLRDPRQLLITVLLGNMTVNTLYFVVSSVLLMQADAAVTWQIGFGVGTLLAMVLLGEVIPKLLFNSDRARAVAVASPLMLGIHRILAPIRRVLAVMVIDPLSRLTAPSSSPPQLTEDELAALVNLSGREGVIDVDEQQLIEQVIRLRRLRVRDVMTPRVRMASISRTADRSDVVEAVRMARLTRLPVHHGDLDQIDGVLEVKPYLLDPRGDRTPFDDHMRPARFLPEMATLEQLLALFRREGGNLAVVVDEYGGTAGIVATEDVVEELVGDIVAPQERPAPPPQLIGRGCWEVSGDMSAHEWVQAFQPTGVLPQASTVGGLIFGRLGRVATPGDRVRFGHVQVTVRTMDGHRVGTVEVTIDDEGGDSA